MAANEKNPTTIAIDGTTLNVAEDLTILFS